MSWLMNLVQQHPTTSALVAYYVFSNAISAMPTPDSASAGFYRWTFDFLHLTAGNISRIVATRYPQTAQAVPESGTPKP